MAKILYGVAGEGFGHSSRSELLGRRLIEAGHELMFAASRKSLRYLRQGFPGQVYEIYGLSFVYRRGKVHDGYTAWQNLSGYRRGFAVNRRFFKQKVHEFKPDLVISDFEPFSSWWAFRNRIPCISIDHEHMLTLCKLDTIENHRKDRILAKLVTRGYHAWVDAYIILNFFKTPVKGKSVVLTPPVIRNFVQQVSPWSGDHIISYSTDSGPAMRKQFIDVLSRFPDQRFFVYGFDQDLEQRNILFKKTSTENFVHDLAGARGVVATAGFSLISECLHFRKKMLLNPLAGQYEQIVNTHYLQKAGLGIGTRKLTVENMKQFLELVEKPFEPDDSIMLPDNERYFEMVEETFNKVGLDVSLKRYDPPRVNERAS